MSAAPTHPAVGDDELAHRVARGAEALAIDLSPQQVDRFVAYVRLIERWNATYNLTAVRDPRDMVTQHILDCLVAAAALLRRAGRDRSRRLLDVGSGAGLPGLVIAAVAPEIEVVCVDSVGKKTAFIAQAAGVLGLKNATAIHSRVEAIRDGTFQVIASRAFAPLADFIDATKHLLAENGTWMAMKGKPSAAELASLSGLTFHVEPLVVPGLNADRCLVWVQPTKSE